MSYGALLSRSSWVAQNTRPYLQVDIVDAPNRTVTAYVAVAPARYRRQLSGEDLVIRPQPRPVAVLRTPWSIYSYMKYRHSHNPHPRRAVFPRVIDLLTGSVKSSLSAVCNSSPSSPMPPPRVIPPIVYALIYEAVFMETNRLAAHLQNL